MADFNFATISFLSWVRQGLPAQSGLAGSVSVADGHFALPIALELNGSRLPKASIQIYGPGDVTGIDAREVIRTEPQHLMTDFEPNYFPFVEFDHPDFPWMFTPAGANAAQILQPWLCLVVVRRDAGSINVDTTKPLPVLDCPVSELPDPSESWMWAHAQVARTAAMPKLNDALGDPTRNLSRLLSPRRLDPSTGYYACVVPTFAVGRKAGLGETFTKAEEAALEPAWTVPPAGATPQRIQLPVYYHWEFNTGLEADFEALARRLQPQNLPANTGVHEVDVSTPGWNVGPFPPTASGAVVQMEGALRNPARKAQPWADDVRIPFQATLRQILNTAVKPPASGSAPSAVAPPLYGQSYPKLETLPAAGSPPFWFSEANLDVRFRIAAGLGAQVVRFEQEDLMAAAWDQLAAQRTDNEQIKRAQLAEAVGQTFLDKHLAPLSPEQFVQVTAPIHAALRQGMIEGSAPQALSANESAAASAKPSPPGAAALLGGPVSSAAFRRLARSRGPLARRAAMIAGRAIPGASQKSAKKRAGTATPFAPTTARPTRAISALLDPAAGSAPATASLSAIKSHLLGQMDPGATALASVQQTVPEAQSTELLQFAPDFSQPMYEALRDFFSDMLLPGLENIPRNSITLLETNPQFVEAYMLGLNHEMGRELLWRGFPADRRGTYFRRFWDVSSHGTVPGPEADIKPVAEWQDNTHMGDHSLSGASASMMILAIRGDLLARYPRAMVYAVEALWSSTAADARRDLGTKELYPMFRVTRAPDITMLGFGLTAQQARGADRPTAAPNSPSIPSNDAGWFFILQEQPTELRFGLDAANDKLFGTRPAQWNDLSWAHLAPNAGALKKLTYVPLNGTLKGLTLGTASWGKNSAHMAFIVRQSPFRLAVHARTWLPT